MEKIDINILLDDLMQDEDFNDSCEQESPKWTFSTTLSDAIDIFGKFDKNNYFPKGSQFKFEIVDGYREKGDRKDEETLYGIFKRKSDGKFFKAWINDAGFIGPETLTLCEYMEEVRKESRKIKSWRSF
jgi:hypothetical protein